MILKKSDLYPYQERNYRHIIDHYGSMEWCDIGLGKTIISLTAIEHLLDAYDIRAALVIGPLKVVKAVWVQEARKWEHTQRLTFSEIMGTPEERLKALRRKADVYLINYENIKWLVDTLQTRWIEVNKVLPFDMVVFDESSKMKNSTSKRVKSFCKILTKFKYRVGLTGTPAANGVIDLHGQYLMVDGGHRLGPNITYYRSRWFLLDPYKRRWVPRRGAIAEIQSAISDITMETKAEDYLQLPPLVDKDIIIELPEEKQKQYEKFEKEFFLSLNDKEVEAFNAGAKSMKCRQLANGAVYTDARKSWAIFHDEKLDAVREILEELNGKSALICYQFKSDAERLKEAFPDAVLLDNKNVQEKVEHWNAGKIPLLIGHPAAMGHGLNIQYGGNTIIWFGVPWSLELYDQAIGRLKRNGQKGGVVINHRITIKNTVEEAIIEALASKDKTQRGLRDAVKRYRERKGK